MVKLKFSHFEALYEEEQAVFYSADQNLDFFLLQVAIQLCGTFSLQSSVIMKIC